MRRAGAASALSGLDSSPNKDWQKFSFLVADNRIPGSQQLAAPARKNVEARTDMNEQKQPDKDSRQQSRLEQLKEHAPWVIRAIELIIQIWPDGR